MEEVKTTPMSKTVYYTDQQLSSLITKYRFLGFPIEEIEVPERKQVAIIHLSEDEHLVVIPSDVKALNSASGVYKDDNGNERWNGELEFTRPLRNYKGNLKVVGGSGLYNLNIAFENCRFDNIDLTMLNASNVHSMRYTFSSCAGDDTTEINFGDFDTSNVTDMTETFSYMVMSTPDFSKFNTSNVRTMKGMFKASMIKELDLHTLDFKNVCDMDEMFSYIATDGFELGDFYTPGLRSMERMFAGATLNKLDLGKINTSRVNSMREAFRCLKILGDKPIDLSTLSISPNISVDTNGAFDLIKSNVKLSDQRLLDEYETRLIPEI